MKPITKARPTKSTARPVAKVKAKIARQEVPVIKFRVSTLTKPWAVKGAEDIIRALSGSALHDAKVVVEIDHKKSLAKRANAHD